MIHDAAHTLGERGFTIVEQVEDEYGTIGYVVSFLDNDYCVVAKDYAYDDLASFMARLVVHAPDEMDFIFYCEDDATYTVFDGEYLREHGDKSHGESKKRDCSWIELSRTHGALLDNYLRGIEEPDTLSGDNQTLEQFT